MDLTPYVDNLRHELAVAAESSGEDAQALAERLTAPLDSAARLTLLEVLSAATEEISRGLAPGSVEVRLRGRNPDFVVTPPPASQPAGGPPPMSFRDSLAKAVEVTFGVRPPATSWPDDGGMSRITLRIPDHLKARVDVAAGREGLSVNAWLLRVISVAVELSENGRGEPG